MDRIKENTSIEFKTSLFHRAGCPEAGYEQIDIIVRTLSAFMNSEGGTLYMGWHDSGRASASIIEEYKYLNQYPAFSNNVYNENEDGYRLFIQDWASKHLGNYAVSLLNFEFIHEGYILTCKISVKKSSMPIWFDRRYLWIRCDGSTRRLLGDDITRFIMDNKDLKLIEDSNMDKYIKRAKEQIDANSDNKKKRSSRILVVYPNGDYVYNATSSIDTMIEVIKRAGIQNVIALDLVGRKGKGTTPYVPFIGREEYLDNKNDGGKSGKTQRELDGYYIFTKYSLGDLKLKIEDISRELGLRLHVETY